MPVFGQKPDTGHSPARRRGSLWRISFASFFVRAKKEARRRRRDRGNEWQRQAANPQKGQRIIFCGGNATKDERREFGRRLFALRRDPISFSGKEMEERNRQREPISRRFPLDFFPDAQGGCGPHWIPQGDTKDEGKRSLPPKHLTLF